MPNVATENNPDAGINCDHALDKHCQAYGKIVSRFRHWAKDNIVQPYNTQGIIVQM